MGPIIVLILRILVPFGIFKHPLAFGVICLILDGLDVVLIDALGTGAFPLVDNFYDENYHFIDKILDTYYLTFEMIISLRWKEKLARNTSIILYAWRLVGVILFEITGIRKIIFFAPNLFENFFIFYLVARKKYHDWEIKSFKRLFIILFLLYIPKFGQEYVLHWQEAQPWTWFKARFLN